MLNSIKFAFIKKIKNLEHKCIAVVYSFQDEQAEGSKHYDFWNMDVVAPWLQAIETIKAIPYILDVRTFCEKALNDTLPKIDFVLNLNAGNVNLSTLGLVSSCCSFKNIPCIPASSSQILTGEQKHFSNLIASSIGIQIPPYSSSQSTKITIKRPINFGSSIGIEKGIGLKHNKEDIIQDFISGIDMTVPFLYHPLDKRLVALPTIIYYPNNLDLTWFHGQESKSKQAGYIKKIITLDEKILKKYLHLTNVFNITSFCRIDLRINIKSLENINDVLNGNINEEQLYFLELNTMPTIKPSINFVNSLEVAFNSSLKEVYNIYKETVPNASAIDYILTSTLLGFDAKAMHYK